MNRNLYIYISILILGLGIGSCSSHKEEKAEAQAQAMRQDSLTDPEEIRSKPGIGYANSENEKEKNELEILTADTLSKAEQDAMIKRAQEKRDDYYSYEEIINNPQYDTSLRNHARVLAEAMFVSKSTDRQKNTISTGLNGAAGTYTVTVTDANGCEAVVSGLAYSGKDSTYSGSLPVRDKNVHPDSKRGVTGFVVRKVPKQFGNKEIKVWEVFLR
ncbi:MAG: hypothetical protein ACHQRM_16365 [Bacteroidia bacterium]